jgi:hypothetical protein
MRASKIAKNVGLSGVAFAALFTGVMGFAHTHAGRPLLVAMRPVMKLMAGSKGGCPFGYDKKASPEEKEAARAAFSETHRGEAPASARPALGFTLDATTPADVTAWAKAGSVECSEKGGGVTHSDLECRDVPASLLTGDHAGGGSPGRAVAQGERAAGVSSLWLTFGKNGTLTSVVAVRSDRRAEVISEAFSAARDDVALEAGPPSAIDGSGTAKELASGLLVESTAEYRFTNYYALARAANTGSAYVLTEEYRSLAD